MAGEDIKALKRAVGATTDVELATKLGIERSTVAQWKRRGGVPDKYSYLIGLSDFPGDKNLNAVRHHLLGRSEHQYLLKAALAFLPNTPPEWIPIGDQSLGIERERVIISLMSFTEICAGHYLLKPCPETPEEYATLVWKMATQERLQIDALTSPLMFTPEQGPQ